MRRTGTRHDTNATTRAPRPVWRLLVIASAVALVVAGCGSDDDGAIDDASPAEVDAPGGSGATTPVPAETSTSTDPNGASSDGSPEFCALFEDDTFLRAWVPADMGQFVVEEVEVAPVPDGTTVTDLIAEATDGCVRNVVVSYVGLSGTVETVASVGVAPSTGDVAQPVQLGSPSFLTWEPVDGQPDTYFAKMGPVPFGGAVVVGDLVYVILNGEMSTDVAGEAEYLDPDTDMEARAEQDLQEQLAFLAEAERDLATSLRHMADTLG